MFSHDHNVIISYYLTSPCSLWRKCGANKFCYSTRLAFFIRYRYIRENHLHVVTQLQPALKWASWTYPVSNEESRFSSFTEVVSSKDAIGKDFCHLSGISVEFFLWYKYHRLKSLWPQTKIFIKMHEKYQKGNIFGFYRILKNTTETPDRWEGFKII